MTSHNFLPTFERHLKAVGLTPRSQPASGLGVLNLNDLFTKKMWIKWSLLADF